MSAAYALQTTLPPSTNLVLLDVLHRSEDEITYVERWAKAPDRHRSFVRVRCRLCGKRKTMLRQTALQAKSCGCALEAPVACPTCGRVVPKRGLAGHTRWVHGPGAGRWL